MKEPGQVARTEVMRLMREDFDPTPPNWGGREWYDNAEDVADKIIKAVIDASDAIAYEEGLNEGRAEADSLYDRAIAAEEKVKVLTEAIARGQAMTKIYVSESASCRLKEAWKAYPRTCPVCGLGPCALVKDQAMINPIKEAIARVLYDCEKRRADNVDKMLGLSHSTMEPWDDSKESFLGDAEAILPLITQARKEERERCMDAIESLISSELKLGRPRRYTYQSAINAILALEDQP